MRFVEDIKDCWKWFSVQAMTIATAIQGGWMMLDADMRAVIPHSDVIVPAVTSTLLVFGILGRLVDQTKKPDAP